MDPIKKFRIVFWVVFAVLIVAIAAGSYFFLSLNNWKEDVIGSKDAKIAELEKKLSDSLAGSDQTAGTNQSLTAANAQLTKDKDELTAENKNLKSNIASAVAYNNFFGYMNTVVETHNGFTGWTDAEFQTGKSYAEKTGSTSFVSTINWAWYETSVAPATRIIRVWKETQSGIESALK